MSKVWIAALGCGLLGLSASVALATTSTDMEGHKVGHRHHVARYHAKSAPVSDVPQESAAPAEKADPVPEYFNHAVGSDSTTP